MHYIAYVPIYHICHTGFNQNHKKLFYYIFYMESVLWYFRLVKEDLYFWSLPTLFSICALF